VHSVRCQPFQFSHRLKSIHVCRYTCVLENKITLIKRGTILKFMAPMQSAYISPTDRNLHQSYSTLQHSNFLLLIMQNTFSILASDIRAVEWWISMD
jgi:hypothetical protein